MDSESVRIAWPSGMQPQKAASKDPGRYAINGVALRRSDALGAHLAATDGRCLVVVPVDVTAGQLNGKASILDLSTAKVATDYGKRLVCSTAGPELEVDLAGAVTVQGIGERYSSRVLDGEFPNIDAVIPEPVKAEGETRVRLAFNIKLLVALAQAMGVEDVQFVLPIEDITPNAGRVADPILVQPLKCPYSTEDGRKPVGVLMPYGAEEVKP